jgi:hypothetical protein
MITFFIGSISILIGLNLEQQLNAQPIITILPLLLICPPVVFMVNWLTIRRKLTRIETKSSEE